MKLLNFFRRSPVCAQPPLRVEDRPDWYARLGCAHTAEVFGRQRSKPSHQVTVEVKATDLSAALGELNRHWGGCFAGEK